MVIIIDTRESRSLVPSELQKLGIECKYETLEVADYLIGEVAIERKTILDYVNSLKSGHLSTQLYNMSTEYPISALVIEYYIPEEEKIQSNEQDINQLIGIHRHSHLSSLAGGFIKRSPDGKSGVISYFSFDTPYDTALFLKYCHDKVESGEPRLPKITNKGISSDDRLISILTGFPYIGEVNASKLLKRFGTISSVSCADLKSLKEVLGEKRAESVFAWFHAPYKTEDSKKQNNKP